MIFARGMSWIDDFKSVPTWAQRIRHEADATTLWKGGNQHTENFRKICAWVDDRIDDNGSLNLSDFKQKYEEITGSPSGDWPKLNKRIRDRLNICSVFIIEKYIGSRNKARKLQKWRWERKV